MSIIQVTIQVAVPDDKATIIERLAQINRENGLDDSGDTYADFCDEADVFEENPDGFDPSDFAYFVVENRTVSETADQMITYIDMEDVSQ